MKAASLSLHHFDKRIQCLGSAKRSSSNTVHLPYTSQFASFVIQAAQGSILSIHKEASRFLATTNIWQVRGCTLWSLLALFGPVLALSYKGCPSSTVTNAAILLA